MNNQLDDAPLTFEQVVAAERRCIGRDEDPNQSMSALCISGGGIRSATFALGAIQGLAEKGILTGIDYLSTVSGGGYIGSWLSAWKQRGGGLDKIVPALKPTAPFPPAGEPDPLQHLREYNNYLSPKLGIFSADTWTLAATVGRNMLLNWLVLIPLLMFVLLAPRLLLSLSMLGDHFYNVYGVDWGHHTPLKYVLIGLADLTFAIAAFNTFRYLPGVGGKNHTEAGFIKGCLVPIVGAALLFFLLEAWITGGDIRHGYGTSLTYPGVLAGVLAPAMVAWIIYFLAFFKSLRKRLGLVAGMTFAILLLGLSTGALVWLLDSQVYPRIAWAPSISFVPTLLLLAFALPVTVFVGLTSQVLGDEDREWLSRAAAFLLLFILGWSGVCALGLLAPAWIFRLPLWERSGLASAGGISGILTAIGGFILKDRSKAKGSHADAKAPSSFVSTIILQLAAAAFVTVLLVCLALLTNWLLSVTGLVSGDWTKYEQFLERTPPRWVLLAGAIFLGFAWAMARFIDINKFSLHAMYRNRLIRAYIGASNRPEHTNQFIGFSQDDDIPMHELKPELRPFHVVNTTLNLVSGKRLAWQQRKAEVFTVTPLHCGSWHLGFRPSKEYGGGVSLGTAMTLSGAAASPNMGYYSSPVIGFIMTLFNARLGAWLGNPGTPGKDTWRHEGPKSAMASIVRETFGLTNEAAQYVYLSDGGHFENLGLYAMIRRGCRHILVLDGAADGDFEFNDLGNALRKVRIDTKIDIQFDESWDRLRERKDRWAVGRICYRDAGKGEDGFLIYIKPMVRGSEPPDVVAYHAANPDFPHESTANQFFNESQTESYRMLGLHTVREMFEGWTPALGISGLAEQLRARGGQAKEAVATKGASA
jgi:Patatin-like phospholipase